MKKNNKVGILEHIRNTERQPTKEEINEAIKKAFSQPFRKPNTDKIYCGIEFAEKFNEAMYGKGNKKNTNNTGKVSGKNA